MSTPEDTSIKDSKTFSLKLKFNVSIIHLMNIHIQTYGLHTRFDYLIHVAINCYMHRSIQKKETFYSIGNSAFYVVVSFCFLL